MENKTFTPEGFYEIAYEMGLSTRQVQGLRSNRLFPLTKQKGLGRGKGKRYYYTENSLCELRTLIYWRSQPQARGFKDLRWYLWLFGGWDWIWEDVRKDLLDLFPKVIPDKEDEKKGYTIIGNLFSRGRYKLFRGSKLDLWKLVAPNLVRPFIYNHIAKSTIPPLDRTENHEIIPYIEDMDELLGDGTSDLYQKIINNDIFSLSLLIHMIKYCNVEQVSRVRHQLQEIEDSMDEDEDLTIIRRILGIRPLRSIGLQRIPRAVSLGLLLILNKKMINGK